MSRMPRTTRPPTPEATLASEYLLSPPPPRAPLYEEVARRIIVYILGVGLVAGHRLPSERELAHRLSVSRTSIRQAVAALTARGVIEVRSGDGMYVGSDPSKWAPPSHAGLPDIDVTDAREAIEVKLAELAAVRRTEDDLRALEETITAMSDDIDRGGIGQEAAKQFHVIITRAARSSVLARLMTELSDDFDAARLTCLEHPDRPRRSSEHHRLITAVIRDGDPDAAAVAMRMHLRVMADLAAGKTEAGRADGPTA